MGPVNNSAISANLQMPPALSPISSAELIKKGIFSVCTGVATVAICNQINAIYSTPAENYFAKRTTPEAYLKYLELKQDDSIIDEQSLVLSLVVFGASVGPYKMYEIGKYLHDRACRFYDAAIRQLSQ
ncbi:hypothetical protein [Endozoicomonas sp. GU-1]|uniref:hypothetical protein n=1 Tax=Endozoicomonas sp. GU-1 TaxID=3009078 RepID=UPI0022B3EBF3|nr:hypothetical protein [Endozoicomonas sp. GU-1]WBA80808.1 hypothetical protein O2T12_21240 [Endozoicomonas sp. GU-1]WBA88370.1 hypothetical protein O3276_10430 [Endozoicomonas sp. GU-1]